MKNHTKALLYTGFVILCWSTVATAFKIALSELIYTQLLLIASVTATVVYFISIITEKKTGVLLSCLKDKKRLINTLPLGLINPLIYYLLLFKSYTLLPAQIAQPLTCSWQILLPVLALIFLKRPISAIQQVGLAVSFVGIIFISSQGSLTQMNFNSINGIALALSCAFVWALYWMLKIKSRMDTTVELFLNFLTASVLLTIYFCFEGMEMPTLKGLFAGIYVGVFEMGLAFLCWARALKLSNNTAMLSQLTYLSPFISLILIHFILGEEIYWTTLLGLSLIIGGILISNKKILNRIKHVILNNRQVDELTS